MMMMHALDEEWVHAWHPLQEAAAALDVARLTTAISDWLECALRFVGTVPTEAHLDDGETWRTPSYEHMRLIWARMAQLHGLSAELCAATQREGALPAARRCVEAVCDAMMLKLPNYALDAWEGCPGAKHPPLVGAPDVTLRMELVFYGTLRDCHTEPHSFVPLLEWSEGPMHRKLERMLYYVAALARLSCIHDDWHRLVYETKYSPSLNALSLDAVLCSLTRPVPTPHDYLYDGTDKHGLVPLRNSDMRRMLTSMRSAHRLSMSQRPRPARKTIDAYVYNAGERHVKAARMAFFKSLWRKCLLVRTVALYWQEQTVQRLCATGGAGRAADLAVLAGMGVAAEARD
jgi:hypothetical protein